MSEQKPQYSAEKLQEFKQLIEEKAQSAQEQIDTLKKAVAERKVQMTDNNTGFNEGGKHFQEQAKNKRTIRRMQGKTRGYRAALARIEDGSYGVCERTGKLIREARLRALPTATFDIVPPKK